MSKIGKNPIIVPENIKIELNNNYNKNIKEKYLYISYDLICI